jgi:hypothetical protein
MFFNTRDYYLACSAISLNCLNESQLLKTIKKKEFVLKKISISEILLWSSKK